MRSRNAIKGQYWPGSWVQRAMLERGIQPLCDECTKECKVLDGPISTFICRDFNGNGSK